jgi:hypothetical protein
MVFNEMLLDNISNFNIFFPGSGARYLCFEGAYQEHFVTLHFSNPDDSCLFNIGNQTGKYVFT